MSTSTSTRITLTDSINNFTELTFGFSDNLSSSIIEASDRSNELEFYAAMASIDSNDASKQLSSVIYSRIGLGLNASDVSSSGSGAYRIGLVIKPALNSYTTIIGNIGFSAIKTIITEKDLNSFYYELKLMMRIGDSGREQMIIDFLDSTSSETTIYVSEFINKNYYIWAIPYYQVRQDQDDLEGAVGPGVFNNYKTQTTMIIKDSYNKYNKTISKNYIK